MDYEGEETCWDVADFGVDYLVDIEIKLEVLYRDDQALVNQYACRHIELLGQDGKDLQEVFLFGIVLRRTLQVNFQLPRQIEPLGLRDVEDGLLGPGEVGAVRYDVACHGLVVEAGVLELLGCS